MYQDGGIKHCLFRLLLTFRGNLLKFRIFEEIEYWSIPVLNFRKTSAAKNILGAIELLGKAKQFFLYDNKGNFLSLRNTLIQKHSSRKEHFSSMSLIAPLLAALLRKKNASTLPINFSHLSITESDYICFLIFFYFFLKFSSCLYVNWSQWIPLRRT